MDVSPTRPTRRAAAQRRLVLDDSDEENVRARGETDDELEDFKPAVQNRSRRQSRMQTAKGRGTSVRRSRAGIEETEQSVLNVKANHRRSSPTKAVTSDKASPKRKRQTIMPDGSTSVPIQLAPPSGELLPVPPTKANIPQASARSGDQQSVLQSETRVMAQAAPIKAFDKVLERPMDIVIRSRALPMEQIKSEDTGPRPRTVIEKLVLLNFKSYAGRQEVGPFHRSFSSVVGPNGSGKSNVIDSLLFVFGFRASKMRQGNISALIHNSAAFPNLDSCEVEVHFQEIIDKPDGQYDVLPDSTLIISRKAFKSNASKYYINARESNFTHVTTLLREKGVDLDHKRFLILQGEVESIAQMKPKAANEHDDGLLEYLEDIIGTSKYKGPIEESAAEIDRLNEVCVEKSGRVQHVEREKNGLEEKKNKAIAYVKDENDLATNQSCLYQIYVHECSNNLQVSSEAIMQAQASLDAELAKHQGSEDGMRRLQESYDCGTSELEKLQKATQDVVKEMARHDKERVKYEEKKNFLQNKHAKQEKVAQTAHLSRSEAVNSIQQCSDDIAKSSREIADIEAALQGEEAELEKIRESLKGKTQDLSRQISAKQKALDPWTAKINEATSAMAIAQSELDILKENASAGTSAVNEAQGRVTAIENKVTSKKARLQELQQEKSCSEEHLTRLHNDLAQAGSRNKLLRARLTSARQSADEARASLNSSQSQSNVLSGLLRLKESGRIEGFHGRLGNLGTIDQKYDVAISTACPSLDNLVVDHVDVGQQCIEYLRKNNLGRANIILLDRLAHRDLTRIETPENAPRLFDLVKAKDDIFRPAFYSVLHNTLVAKDLEQANRIAYGARRWRVVTLDGQLIDVSGTMSGGGSRVARGGMSSKLVAETTKEQVLKVEKERDQLELEAQDHAQQQASMESDIQSHTQQIPALETEIQKGHLELSSLQSDLIDAQRRVKEMMAEQRDVKVDGPRMASLSKLINSHEHETQRLRGETAGIEDEIRVLQEKVMEVGGVRLRAQKAKVDGLKEQIATLADIVSNKEIARSKAEKQKVKHEKAARDMQKDQVKANEELDALLKQGGQQAQAGQDLRQRVDEAQENLTMKQEELGRVKEELESQTEVLNRVRAIEIEMRNKLEENQKFQVENQKRLRYWTDKLSSLKLQSLDNEFEVDDIKVDICDDGEQKQGQRQEPTLPQYTADELSDMNKDKLKATIAALEERIQNTNVELGVLGEYRRRLDEYKIRAQDLQVAVTARDTAKRQCDELRQMRLEGFMTGFTMISLRLKEMYQMITMGGNAELELVDSLDPFSEGILFSVMPPKKSWKNISNLSGGEKTLSSLALVFALHHYKPTPLYVMDEIDAALDFRNVSIVASYIKERTKNAQFIVISLRNNMFELASRLVGIYKVNHMTRSVTVENRDYTKPLT